MFQAYLAVLREQERLEKSVEKHKNQRKSNKIQK